MSSKAEILERLDELAQELIFDRSQSDVDKLLNLFKDAYDDMIDEQKAFINTPQKGAYSYTDQNRVGEFCNLLVELMETYYGVETDDYKEIFTSWQTITDPTEEQLTGYINSILALRDEWYQQIHFVGYLPEITQIYDGISLETANNIEKVLDFVYDSLKKHMFKNDYQYCGMLRGPDSSYVLTCGSVYWIGVNNA